MPEQLLPNPVTKEHLSIEASDIKVEDIFPDILRCSMIDFPQRLELAKGCGLEHKALSMPEEEQQQPKKQQAQKQQSQKQQPQKQQPQKKQPQQKNKGGKKNKPGGAKASSCAGLVSTPQPALCRGSPAPLRRGIPAPVLRRRQPARLRSNAMMAACGLARSGPSLCLWV